MTTPLSKEVIHIVLGLHDSSGNYVRHSAVTMASIFYNTHFSVCIHFIHDDSLTCENKTKLIQLVNYFGQEILFHEINRDVLENIAYSVASKKERIKMFSVGKLYRLKIIDFLKTVNKAIYLDSDIVVNMDIHELWQEDVHKYYCAAVRDSKETREKLVNKIHFKRMNLNPDCYFNSGVLLMNLNKIRKELNLFTAAINFMRAQAENRIFVDQDALNFLFQKETKFLSKKYNFIPTSAITKKICEEQNAIIHFAGPKPWNFRSSSYDWLYWKYYSMTPWGDSPEKLLQSQQNIGVDLGYALQIGEIASRKNLIKGIGSLFYRMY